MPTPRRTRATLASVLLLTFASPYGRANETPPPGPSGATAVESQAPEHYRSILSEFEAGGRAFSAAYAAAKDDAERQKVRGEKYPDAEAYARRFVAFAGAAPDDPAAVDALVWVARRTRQGEAHDQALRLLSGRHVGDEKIADALPMLAYSGSAAVPDTLRTIAEKSPNRKVRGQALFALAQYHKDRDKEAEAERGFEEVAAKYADVASYSGTLGEAARANLHEIRDLAIGKVAPEIEGEDVDGKRFKLSEYRGKVVVLDFWGDW